MRILHINNPYQAPVYFVDHCESTQTLARNLISTKPVTGTVITAAYQNKGRGRGTNRLWSSAAGESLLFTVMFQYENMSAVPKAFTLRIGLAVAEAVSEFVPGLKNHVTVKWPNDVMIGSRKVCGILAENDGRYILTGIGVNVNQLEFSAEISGKAVSIRQALGEQQNETIPAFDNHILLEKNLFGLQKYLSSSMDKEWNSILRQKLYKRGESISFIPGQADSRQKVEGILEGIGPDGDLLIKTGPEIKSYITGELEYQYIDPVD